MKKVIVYIDGAARPNPGPSGIGGIFFNEEETVALRQFSRFIGNRTNNQAEYEALLEALKIAKKITTRVARTGLILVNSNSRPFGARLRSPATNTKFFIRTDSELLYNQIKGTYQVKDPILLNLFKRVKKTEARLNWTLELINRRANRKSDQLAKQAIARNAE